MRANVQMNKIEAMAESSAAIPDGKRWLSVTDAIKLVQAHLQAGRVVNAEQVAADIVAARPRNPDAHHLLGIAFYRQQKMEKAIKSIERAIDLAPATGAFHANLAEMYRLKGQPELGLAAGEKAVTLNPKDSQGWNNLGIIHFDRQDFVKAESCYRNAVLANENFGHAWNNLGNALVRLERDAEAHEAFARAILLTPNYSECMVNDGLSYREEGELDLAEERLRQAVQVNPRNANAQVSLAILQKLKGDYGRGMMGYEWRLALPEARRQNLPGQRWKGEAIAGKRLFVYAEQGLGDVIQYLRYLAPLAMRRPASIMVQVQPGLHKLAELSLPGVQFVKNPPARDQVDLHCAIMSLPFLLRLPILPAEPQGKYLTAPEDMRISFRERFAKYEGLKVGLVWQGNTSHKFDHHRSMPGEFLLPLIGVPDCHFFSLQIGHKAADGPFLDSGLVDLSKDVSSMTATAAAICELDLVIAVDTSLAHLAGALGAPVWTALSHVPDWRWGLAANTTPLYRSMHLFRQAGRRDWASVVAQMEAPLREKVASKMTNPL